MNASLPRALTIAGSDSGGGAGIQADLKTFMAFGVYGASVITALTAQNTREVTGVFRPDPDFVFEQFMAVMTDIGADAAKTGMLFDSEIIEAVAHGLDAWPIDKLVVDPVMISKSGAALLAPQAIDRFRELILPRAAVITPNIPEAEVLSGIKIEIESHLRAAAEKIVALGARAVLLKGGHSADHYRSDDLFYNGRDWIVFQGPRIDSKNTHGTGCTLSAAITALLARGEPLDVSIREAKAYVTRAIETAPQIGSGAGPLNHGVKPEAKEAG